MHHAQIEFFTRSHSNPGTPKLPVIMSELERLAHNLELRGLARTAGALERARAILLDETWQIDSLQHEAVALFRMLEGEPGAIAPGQRRLVDG
jgi:hypothetical protein